MSHIVGLELPPAIYDQLGAYLQLLLRWNAKTNLTAVRDPEQIVTRHFGESLFAAGVLFGDKASGRRVTPAGGNSGSRYSPHHAASGAPFIPAVGISGTREAPQPETTLADFGSGAGFPGIPIKLAFPQLQVTLIESQNKKATFLKEVIRALRLDGIEVYNGRAEHWSKHADVVTLRAVESFESVLPVATHLLAPGGRLCLLIGSSQAKALAGVHGFDLQVEHSIPGRADSLVVVGKLS